jgi:hypothetical protein
MNAKVIIVISLASILIIIKIYSYSIEVEYIKSDVDENTYLVRNLPNAEHASDILAKLRKDIIDFIQYLHDEKYNSANDDIKPKIKRLYEIILPNMQSNNFSESTPSEKYTSYTVNKTKLYFCLRQKDDNRLINYNIIMFVALHELTHMMNEEYDPHHENGFWEDMTYLLENAIEYGIYVYQPYNKLPVEYCGIVIDNTPLQID